MSSPNQDRGTVGEEIAATWLEARGFRILYRNFRYRHLELDIVALEEDTLVFVEVKSRASLRHGPPEEAVTPAKQRFLLQAAEAFLQLHPQGMRPSRFDVVAVIERGRDIEVRHVRDAFHG